jgi:hypothetical protein
MRAGSRAIVALGIALVPLAAAGDTPASLCVVRRGSVEGLDEAALRAAIDEERHKWSLVFTRIEAPDETQCPGPVPEAANVVLLLSVRIEVRGADGVVRDIEIESVAPPDRPREIARLVMAQFPRAGSPVAPQIVEPDPPRIVRAAPPADPAPAAPDRMPGWYLLAGGAYAYQSGSGVHAGGPTLEGGLTWFDERLSLGVRVGWMPSRDVPGAAPPASAQSVPVTVTVRGGVALGPVLLRVGAEVGAEWRSVSAQPGSWIDEPSVSGTAAVLGGEVEMLVTVWRAVRLSIALTGRGYAGGDSWAWHGSPVYEAPNWAVGAAFRVGLAFPPPDEG